MRSMFEACKMGMRPVLAAMVAVVAACTPADGGGGGGDDGPIDRPDARPQHPERVSCQAGDPPCVSNTECVNFGIFGDQVCAEYCEQSTDCADGLVCIPDGNGKGVCATAEWGGAGGIYPEFLCRDENACNTLWDDNENGCKAYLDACLGGLSASQVQQWTQQVAACLNASTCSSAFSCFAEVPWC
ncbi:MAG: hypothetical protein K8W52_39475 [Deltaproteobacteria bacterium]|nr:hypothetical protein [Deltaproteobacteria bacterium]